jgi:hypothetical protein
MSSNAPARAVCSDDGARIVVAVYSSDPPALAAAELAPLAALRLAQDLVQSALRHIAREAAP